LKYNREQRRKITNNLRKSIEKMSPDQRTLQRQRLMADYMAFMAADFEATHGAIDDTELFMQEVMADIKKFLTDLGSMKT